MSEEVKPVSAANNVKIIFRKTFYSKALSTFLITWLIVQMLNISHPLPVLWFSFSFVSVYCFFYYLHKFSISWGQYPEPLFKKKLFRKALTIRIIFIVFLYY